METTRLSDTEKSMLEKASEILEQGNQYLEDNFKDNYFNKLSKYLGIVSISLLLILPLILTNINLVSAEDISSNELTIPFTITAPSTDNTDTENPDTNHDDSCNSNKQYKQTIGITNEGTIYGEWKCINHQLQRTNIINNKEKTELGGVCGLNLDLDNQIDNNLNTTNQINSNFLLASFLLSISILISLICIALVLLIK